MAEERFRVVFAGGGTGGHLYPALVVAEALERSLDGVHIGFVGARRGIEQRLVPRAGYPLFSLPLSGVKGRGITARVAAVAAAAWGLLRCVLRFLLRRPHLVIGVGGYASGPAVLAAKGLGVPTMVMEQNHFPGATNRWLAPRVNAVCVPSEDARRRFGGIGVVTGNPVRREFFATGEPPLGARPSLLVFGGSRGARSINRAMLAAIPALAALDPVPHVVHQTGDADLDELRAAAASYPEGLYEVHGFLDDMPARLADADLVVCRAGASTLSELTAAGRPAVLIPYPYAADDHQRHNAVSLKNVGAATVLSDDQLGDGRLVGVLEELLFDRDRLRAMGSAARELAHPDAAGRIVAVARELLGAAGGSDVP